MYESISDFLKDLGTNSPALWAVFVLGVIITISLGLYSFWETVLKVAFPGSTRANKNH